MSTAQVISLKSLPSLPAPATRFELGGSPCFFLKEKLPTNSFLVSPVFCILQVGKGLKSGETNYIVHMSLNHWALSKAY